MYNKFETFDVLSYLQSRNIGYKTSGKNVSSGWVGINCLYCIDNSNHLGINLHSKTFNCFRCGETGNAIKLIQTIEGSSVKNAFEIVEKFNGGVFTPKKTHYQSKLTFPIGATKTFYSNQLKYLEKRNFNPEIAIKTYDLYSVGPIGDFKHRIIIPIYMNKRIVAYVGRDTTEQAEIPYKNSPEEFSIKPVKSCLYNIDSVYRNTAIIVEGIFDSWRIGDGAIATFGTQYTHEQIRLLKGLARVFVMYDSDALNQAKRLAHDVSAIVPYVEVVALSEGDPDNLSAGDVQALRKDLGL